MKKILIPVLLLGSLSLSGQIRNDEVFELPEMEISDLRNDIRIPDVDGFHVNSAGRLLVGRPGFRPCTPAGIAEMLDSIGFDCTGKRAVVVGRSNIVGKPMALMLLERNATVTIAHSRTKDLPAVCREADLLVVAVGRAKLVTADYVKEGAVVIDVGMDRDENGKLCGDVNTESVLEKASYVTPVPGGVGPMTIAMLLTNTVSAALGKFGKSLN